MLTLEELDRLCSVFVARGVKKIRITGGEPLVRKNIIWLLHALSRHLRSDALDELTLTTNGSQLPKYAEVIDRLPKPLHASNLVESEEFVNRRKALGSALSMLNERERRIFEARRLAEEPITLEGLAEEFGVSRERVRQIEVCAVEKVQKAVENRVAEIEAPATLPAE